MNLRDFIRETLEQIINGVEDAKAVAESRGCQVIPHAYRADKTENRQLISFDIAVSISEISSETNKPEIRVGEIISAGNGTASELNESHSSRIRFSVPVKFKMSETDNQP